MTTLTVSTKLQELKEEARVKAERLHQVLVEAGPDRDFRKVKSLEGDTAGKVAKFQAGGAELAALNRQIKEAEEIEGIARQVQDQWRADNEPANPIRHPVPGQDHRLEVKSLGRLLVESRQYQDHRSMRNWPAPLVLPQFDIRAAVFRTGAGWDPENIRISRVELTPVRPIAVIDNIPMLPTSADNIRYMEETTFTQAAAETAESTATTASDLFPEAALALTERSNPVEMIAVFLPVTMQQMEDVEGIQGYVDSRLTYATRARLDLQCLAGDGVTPNLKGTEAVSGIQAQALGADSIPDAIYKAATKVRDDGFAEPSVVFIRPSKWQNVRLLKTADGLYIWGHPSEAGPANIWGVPVVQTTAVTTTKAILGDYLNFSTFWMKRGITIEVSDSHAHYFTRGMLAVRATMRGAMVHYRPKAFAEVTGL